MIEIRRLRMATSVAWLALLLNAVFVAFRGIAANRFPWGNLFEYTVLLCFVSVGIVLLFVINDIRKAVFLPWVLVPVVSLLFYAGVDLYVASAPVPPALKSGWYYIHVTTVSVGASVALVSSVFSIMFLLKTKSDKRSGKGVLATLVGPLPRAAQLDGLAYRSAVWALPIFGLGIIFGSVWAEAAWGRFWNWDPKETISFVTWILYAAYLHTRSIKALSLKFAAWVNVIAFATMIFNLFFINKVVSGLHSYAGLN